jgi:hypothetical protein
MIELILIESRTFVKVGGITTTMKTLALVAVSIVVWKNPPAKKKSGS